MKTSRQPRIVNNKIRTQTIFTTHSDTANVTRINRIALGFAPRGIALCCCQNRKYPPNQERYNSQ